MSRGCFLMLIVLICLIGGSNQGPIIGRNTCLRVVCPLPCPFGFERPHFCCTCGPDQIGGSEPPIGI
ncbi:hypothetical protein DPMN_150747 [Dreissena polymorpha]|uniref:Uncharacterized protein n=1 Tax=Dreissena polymorpha TaxID=45954 RepID=A0A9D4FF53_DREPO|nr:hypothetical protein DPMN_150747 [Dreissena polymorpha]